MKRFAWTIAAIATVAVMALGFAARASAAGLSVRVTEPTPAVLGQPGDLQATLTSTGAGQTVAGVPVTFYVRGTFGKVSGFMEIGRAVTNADGVATVSYVPREGGTHDVRVDYTAGGGSTQQATASVEVAGAPAQLYVQHAGVQIPGINSSLIIVVLSTVWAILFGVGITLIRIADAGRRQPALAAQTAEGAGRSVALDRHLAAQRRAAGESGVAGGS